MRAWIVFVFATLLVQSGCNDAIGPGGKGPMPPRQAVSTEQTAVLKQAFFANGVSISSIDTSKFPQCQLSGTTNNRLLSIVSGGKLSLLAQSLTPSLSGQYSCPSSVEGTPKSFDLVVVLPLKFTPPPQSIIKQSESVNVRVTCKVSGYPMMKLSWRTPRGLKFTKTLSITKKPGNITLVSVLTFRLDDPAINKNTPFPIVCRSEYVNVKCTKGMTASIERSCLNLTRPVSAMTNFTVYTPFGSTDPSDQNETSAASGTGGMSHAQITGVTIGASCATVVLVFFLLAYCRSMPRHALLTRQMSGWSMSVDGELPKVRRLSGFSFSSFDSSASTQEACDNRNASSTSRSEYPSETRENSTEVDNCQYGQTADAATTANDRLYSRVRQSLKSVKDFIPNSAPSQTQTSVTTQIGGDCWEYADQLAVLSQQEASYCIVQVNTEGL